MAGDILAIPVQDVLCFLDEVVHDLEALLDNLAGDNKRSARQLEDIRKYLNADSLFYLTQEGMVTATGLPREAFCMACYDGQYPVAFDPALNKHAIERRNGRVMGLTEALAKEREQIRLL